MRELNIDIIKEGMPGITPAIGNYLLENCMVSLHASGHADGIAMQVRGLSDEIFNLHWKGKVTDQMTRSYQDDFETTEQGAVCISVLVATHLTDYTIVERSWRGTGIDYWLGYADDPFLQRAARLEISGIKTESAANTVLSRYEQKAQQTVLSDGSNLPAYISIVEFSAPKCLFNQK